MSAIPVISIVQAAFALGAAFRERAETAARLAPITVLLQPVEIPNPNAYIRTMLKKEEIFGPGAPYGYIRATYEPQYLERTVEGFLIRDDAPNAVKDEIFDAVIDATGQDWIRDANEEGRRFAKNRFSLYTLKSWTSELADLHDRRHLILSICDTALSFLSYNTEALGLGNKAERVVGMVAEGLNTFINDNRDAFLEPDMANGFARRMADTLVTASLTMAAERPELFSGREHVQELVRAVMNPLRQLNASNVAANLGMRERIDRVREALRGEIGVSVLEALHDRRDAFFDGSDARKSRVLGIVTESFFDAVVADSRDQNEILSAGFLRRTYPAILDAVAAEPAAFVRGDGQHVEAGRDLLQAFAQTLKSHETIKRDPALAQSLLKIGIDLTRRHARRFIVDEARAAAAEAHSRLTIESGEDPWALVSIRIVSQIAESMIDAFEKWGPVGADIADTLDKDFLLDMVGLVAEHAAQTPGMLLPEGANPELVAIAKGVAAFIAADHETLVSQRDWSRVSAVAIDLAMKNPDTLFSLNRDGPEEQLAVRLVERVLGTAKASLLEQGQRGRGRLLFGETLASAIAVTLETAAANAQRFDDPATLDALSDYVNQLNSLAVRSENLIGGLSARDWLTAFSWFVTEVVATGDGRIPPERISAIVADSARRGTSVRAPEAESAIRSDVPLASTIREATLFFQPVPFEGAEG
ncbi:MAG: hypothetical protein V7741_01450 [Hyphomonas sp.]